MAAGDWKDMLTAVHNGDLDLLKHYLAEGINPNYQHPELLTTPLIEAISSQQVEIARCLLEHGADPHLTAGFSQDSPIRVARQTGNKTLIRLVLQYKRYENSFMNRLFERFS